MRRRLAHHGGGGAELRAYDTRHVALRAADAEGLMDPALPALLLRHDIKRISFRPLRERQRNGVIPSGDRL